MQQNEECNKFLDQAVSELGKEKTIKFLADQAGYRTVPVSIDEFLDNPHYAGKFLGKNLYPTWREYLREIYPNPFTSPYSEVILSGAIGLGKSSMCLAGTLYDLYKLTCLKSPHNTFQLLPSTQIIIALMNTTKKLADSVLYKQLKDWIYNSPYFLDLLGQVDKKQLTRSFQELTIAPRLPNKITLVSGSRESNVLGTAIVSGILSELNFQGEHQKEQAFKQFTGVLSRMESRFARGDGFILPGRLWLDSSKSDETGFLERHIKVARTNPRALVIEKAIWQIMGPAGKVKYSGKNFKVFIGDSNNDPFVVENDNQIVDIDPDLIIDVPIEYRDAFLRDIYIALRDKAGVSTWSAHLFFAAPQMVNKALCLNNPCGKVEVDIDFIDPKDAIIDYVDLSALDKNVPYFIHLDLGISGDRTGIALTRSTGETISKVDTVTFEDKVKADLGYRTDLVLAVIPKPGKEVPITKVKNFIIDLTTAGINVGAVSADGFQSKNLLQDLEIAGYPTEAISTDRTKDAYFLWKSAVNDSRWIGPNHPILRKEMSELVDTGKKIDHPPIEGQSDRSLKPSKDLADGVAGSCWLCYLKSDLSKSVTALEAFTDNLDALNNPDVGIHTKISNIGSRLSNRMNRY